MQQPFTDTQTRNTRPIHTQQMMPTTPRTTENSKKPMTQSPRSASVTPTTLTTGKSPELRRYRPRLWWRWT